MCIRDRIGSLPRLRAVAFNGKLAAKLGRRIMGDVAGVRFIDLPSSSPAHAILLAGKANIWNSLTDLIER